MAINVENYFEQKLKFDQKTNPAKTLDQVKADFQKAGVSAEEHYKKWGWAELLSLDTDFDVAQYLADKAALDGKTVDQVIADFKKAGVNPQEHYENWGKGEGLTPVAVGATPGEGEEPGTPNTLTEALDNLLAKEAELDAFLKEAGKIKEVKAATVDGDVAKAVGQVYKGTIDTLQDSVDYALGANKAELDKDRSDSYNQAIIDETKSVLEEKLADAQEAIAAKKDLTKAANALATAQAGYAAAAEKTVETNAEVASAVARVNSLNLELVKGSGTSVALVDGAYPADSAAAKDLANNVNLILDGTEAVIVFKNNKVQVTEKYQDLPGIAALVQAVQADITALKRQESAKEALIDAAEKVLDIENPDWADTQKDVVPTEVEFKLDGVVPQTAPTLLVATDAEGNKKYYAAGKQNSDSEDTLHEATITTDADGKVTVSFDAADLSATEGSVLKSTVTTVAANSDLKVEFTTQRDSTGADYFDESEEDFLSTDFHTEASLSSALSGAKLALDTFNEDLVAYQAIKAQAGQLDTLETEITELVAKLEKEYEINIVDIDAATKVATADSDVFVFAGDSVTISGFGAQGNDMLYVGFGLEEVRLEAGTDVSSSRQGDAAKLEMFIAQIGSDTVISLEKMAFDGSVASGFEGSVITLVGVDADTVKFVDGSIVIA